MEEFIDQRRHRREDDKDMLELLEVYRSIRRFGKWAAALFAFLLVMVSLAIGVIDLFRKFKK